MDSQQKSILPPWFKYIHGFLYLIVEKRIVIFMFANIPYVIIALRKLLIDLFGYQLKLLFRRKVHPKDS